MPKRKSKSKSKKRSNNYRFSVHVKKSPRKSIKRSNKKARTTPKKSKSRGKMTWFGAVAKARKELNITGFVAIKKGSPLYKRAKEIYGPAKTA